MAEIAPPENQLADQGCRKYLDIWQSVSYARWSEKYNILRLAFVMDAKVDIYSSDHDCQGPQDEFTIELSLQ